MMNGMPISVLMTLRFNELEPIYNTDYSPEVAKGRYDMMRLKDNLGDLFPISFIKQDDPIQCGDRILMAIFFLLSRNRICF